MKSKCSRVQREFFYFSLKETCLELQTPVWSTVKILMVEQWKKNKSNNEELTNNCSLWFTTKAFLIISFPFLILFFCRKTLKTCTTMLNLNPDLRRSPQQTLWRMTPLHPSGSKTQDEVSAGIIKYPVMLNLSRPRWIYQNINKNK